MQPAATLVSTHPFTYTFIHTLTARWLLYTVPTCSSELIHTLSHNNGPAIRSSSGVQYLAPTLRHAFNQNSNMAKCDFYSAGRHNYAKREICVSKTHFNSNMVVLQRCRHLHIFFTDLGKHLHFGTDSHKNHTTIILKFFNEKENYVLIIISPNIIKHITIAISVQMITIRYFFLNRAALHGTFLPESRGQTGASREIIKRQESTWVRLWSRAVYRQQDRAEFILLYFCCWRSVFKI